MQDAVLGRFEKTEGSGLTTKPTCVPDFSLVVGFGLIDEHPVLKVLGHYLTNLFDGQVLGLGEGRRDVAHGASGLGGCCCVASMAAVSWVACRSQTWTEMTG